MNIIVSYRPALTWNQYIFNYRSGKTHLEESTNYPTEYTLHMTTDGELGANSFYFLAVYSNVKSVIWSLLNFNWIVLDLLFTK